MSDFNFIPADRLARRHCKTKLRIWAVIGGTYLVFLIASVVLANVFLLGMAGSVGEELGVIENSLSQDNTTVISLREEIAKSVRELKVKRVTSVQPDWSRLLALLAEELGEEVVLKSCRLTRLNAQNSEINKTSTGQASSSGQFQLSSQRYQLSLSGFALTQVSVSNLLLRLERIKLFESVKRVSSYRQIFLDENAVSFAVVCTI